jgi:hypothetical protein
VSPASNTLHRQNKLGCRHRFEVRHNGEAQSLEEIWTIYNPKDKHGVTSDMSKEQLNDLVEFLKTL